MLKLIGMIELS